MRATTEAIRNDGRGGGRAATRSRDLGVKLDGNLEGPDGNMEGRKSVLAAVEGGSMGVFDAIRRLDSDSGTDEARRKNSGVVYTPEWIARSMAALAGAAPGVRNLEENILLTMFVLFVCHATPLLAQ